MTIVILILIIITIDNVVSGDTVISLYFGYKMDKSSVCVTFLTFIIGKLLLFLVIVLFIKLILIVYRNIHLLLNNYLIHIQLI